MAVVFDGWKFAQERELALKKRVAELGMVPRICSVVFDEDAASQLYTRLKFEAAVRVGVEFDRVNHSITDSVDMVQNSVRQLCQRNDVHGVMIQKPSKRVWVEGRGERGEGGNFDDWWGSLTAMINPDKDVDCLTRHNLDLVYAGESRILPATVRAVVQVLGSCYRGIQGKQSTQSMQGKQGTLHKLRGNSQTAYSAVFHQIGGQARAGSSGGQVQGAGINQSVPEIEGIAGKRVVVVGRSELVGRPLAAVLRRVGAQVWMCGSKIHDLEDKIRQARIVISATGRSGLITGEMIEDGAVVIDVGEPRADVDFESVVGKASFITPVPGGVGPVTVVSLLENLVELVGRGR